MTRTLYKCEKCKTYTLEEEECPKCKGMVKEPYPARFSMEWEKKYSKYRRAAKKKTEERKQKKKRKRKEIEYWQKQKINN